MAYTLGSAANAAALKSAIESFAVANGWTLDASGTLYKSASFVRLDATTQADSVRISAANSINFATEPCPQIQRIYIPAASWPVSYFLFSHANPDVVFCCVNYQVELHQWLAFGEMTKVGSWTGGNWFGASCSVNFTSGDAFTMTPTQSANYVGNYYTPQSPALFWNSSNAEFFGGTYSGSRSSHMHCKINGDIWPGAGNLSTSNPSFPQYADPLHQRTPNLWNDQAVLTPMWLFIPRADGYVSPLGHLEHIRSLRVTNYNSGDVITIGSDKWKVFPWYRKSLTDPNASNGGTSGTFGVAIRYDGP